MAQRSQMLHCLANSFAIVHLEHADVSIRRSCVDKDQRKAPVDELLHKLLFNTEGHHGNTIDATLEHPPYQRLGAGRVVVG